MTEKTPARDRLFALIASIPGSGSVEWCGPARALLDEIAAAAVRPPDTDQTALREQIAEPRALTDAERTMLAYALDQAQEHIWSQGGFTDEDQAAVDSLRRLAAECPQCGDAGACSGGPCPLLPAAVSGRADDETAHSCRNCEGTDPDTCLMNPDRPQPPPMDPVHILGIDAAAASAVGGAQPKEADRIVAYRSALPGAWSIYCTRHTDELGDGVTPLTSDDLPDGGVCASCGADVLIPQQPKEA